MAINRGYIFKTGDGSVNSVYNLLSTTASIDLKSVAATNLYTVPAGKTLFATDVIVDVTAATTVLSAATVSIGKTAAYNEWLAATALTGLNNTNQFICLGEAGNLLVHQTFAAGEILAFNVTVGATGTTLTATVYVIGFLI